MITIVDYGMGNLRSVQKAFEKLGHPARICRSAAELEGTEKMILPGVGAFRDAMAELKAHGFVQPILDHIQSGKPFLGICLGLQLLFDVSYEEGEWPGLGVVSGEVVRFENQPGLKVPHMGWNRIEVEKRPPILDGIPPEMHYYFVHSYHVVPEDESVIVAYTTHGGRFVSIIGRDNLFATQFHPEKSQQGGLKLLENFARL